MPLKPTKVTKALTAKAKELALQQRHFLIQQGKCLLCGKVLTTAKSEAVIDRLPWDKNVIRGLLHRDCKALLQIESPAMLRKLKTYLACERIDFLPKEQKAEREAYKH
jgi:hypothetical protein